jgi:HSP20 family protein
MLFTRNPFADMFRIQREMGHIFNHLHHEDKNSKYLPINIEGNENESILSVEIPGISLEDIQLSVNKNCLQLKIKRVKDEEKGEKYYLQERLHGEWERTIQLPYAVDSDKVEALYEKGILYVSLPKQESELTKKIQIKKS